MSYVEVPVPISKSEKEYFDTRKNRKFSAAFCLRAVSACRRLVSNLNYRAGQRRRQSRYVPLRRVERKNRDNLNSPRGLSAPNIRRKVAKSREVATASPAAATTINWRRLSEKGAKSKQESEPHTTTRDKASIFSPDTIQGQKHIVRKKQTGHCN